MKHLRPALTWAAIAAGFGAVASWLALSAACLYSDTFPLCRHPNGGWIAMLAAVVVVFAPLAFVAARRARRAVGRGMYARPVGGPGRWRWLESAVHFAIEGESWAASEERRGWHPVLDVDDGDGWQVQLEDGAAVVVYFGDFRQWLYDSWEIQERGDNPRQGATSQRTWDRRIGRDQVLARNYLLDVAGGLRRNRTVPNSTARITGTPWTILERLCDVWPPSAV